MHMTGKDGEWRKRRADPAGIGSKLSINIYDKSRRCNLSTTGAVEKHEIWIVAQALQPFSSRWSFLAGKPTLEFPSGDLPFPFLYK
jgi:hypothetical protein